MPVPTRDGLRLALATPALSNRPASLVTRRRREIAMGVNWSPLHEDVWERTFKLLALKDNGLQKSLSEFWSYRSDEYGKRLAALPKVLKYAVDLKNSKEFKAALVKDKKLGAAAAKELDALIDATPKVRKEVEQEQQEAARSGMQEVGVQIILVDWNGKPISSDYVAYVQFNSPGAREVNHTASIGSTGVDIDKLHLKPSGTLYLMVRGPASVQPYMEGTTDYEVRPGKPLMKFRAIQHSKTAKVRAKTFREATEKLGVKGSVGLEFEVLKVGGEVTKESEYKEGYEREVEWEIEYGFPTVKDFKQI